MSVCHAGYATNLRLVRSKYSQRCIMYEQADTEDVA